MKKSKIPITGNEEYEIICSDTSVPESLFVIYCDRNSVKLNKLRELLSDMREIFGEVQTFASLLDDFVCPPPVFIDFSPHLVSHFCCEIYEVELRCCENYLASRLRFEPEVL